MMEHQEKVNRLQRRLSQAEERAAAVSQQVSKCTENPGIFAEGNKSH